MGITITPVTPAVGNPITFAQDGTEQRSGGVGGWESLARPRQDAALGWVGGTQDNLTLPLILNGLAVQPDGGNRTIEPALARLRSWGLKSDKTDQPTILKVTGAKLATSAERWVIDTLEVSDYTVLGGGVIVQANLTVGLIRYVEPVLVAGPAAKARQRAKGKDTSSSKKSQPATKKKSH